MEVLKELSRTPLAICAGVHTAGATSDASEQSQVLPSASPDVCTDEVWIIRASSEASEELRRKCERTRESMAWAGIVLIRLVSAIAVYVLWARATK